MEQQAQREIRACADERHLRALAHRLLAHLTAAEKPLTDHHARAVMQAMGVMDEATYRTFVRLVEKEGPLRLTLYDLLVEGQLSSLVAQSMPTEAPIPWLALVLTVQAHKSGYPLHRLDPSSPPSPHTPAGLAIQHAMQFMRHQVQRQATERDRLIRQLVFDQTAAPTLEEMPPLSTPITPAPPHFRLPVPVGYPEYNDPMAVRENDLDGQPSPTIRPQEPLLRITSEEVTPPPPAEAQRMPPIRITSEQVTPRVVPQATRRQPRSNPPNNPPLGQSLRKMFKSETLKSTKLRILVQEYPDGPGLYGLQVHVTCRGIRSYVAGTTDRRGRFLCELPVRLKSGLTYDVDVTWPRDLGGETERKSITLNADRTEFALPFYRRLQPQ